MQNKIFAFGDFYLLLIYLLISATPAKQALTQDAYKDYGFYWPISGDSTRRDIFTSTYGIRNNNGYQFHWGVDILAWYEPVYASDSGCITGGALDDPDLGNFLVVSHQHLRPELHLLYAHLDNFYDNPHVERRDVKKGDTIAISGNTGNSGGPHLHFAVQENSSVLSQNYLA
jgi:murein DD-endopeptidase MepM/ murein hydrolase activator NlpD